MTFNKGKLKNVNKKLLAGGLALIMVGAPLSGCSSFENSFFDERITDSNGQYVYEEQLRYDTIHDYKVLVFEKGEKYSVFIAKCVISYADPLYLNIFEGACIYGGSDNSSLNLVSEELLSDYLVIYDKVQYKYTAEEIEKILEQIKADYEKENNKQLVKEK